MSLYEKWMQKHFKSRTYIRVIKAHLGNDFLMYANSRPCQSVRLANQVRRLICNIDVNNDPQGDIYRGLRSLLTYLTVGHEFRKKKMKISKKKSLSAYLIRALNNNKKGLVLRILDLKSIDLADSTAKEYANNSCKESFDMNGHIYRAKRKFDDYDENSFITEYELFNDENISTHILENCL